MAAQRADVGMVKKKRGQAFVIDDAKVYLDAVKKMKPIGDQSKAVFLLHTESVKAHFESLEALTKTVRPEDDPFVEHYQTPVVMEILYDQDPQFRKSIDAFVQAIGKSEALIGKGGCTALLRVLRADLRRGLCPYPGQHQQRGQPDPEKSEYPGCPQAGNPCLQVVGDEHLLWHRGGLCSRDGERGNPCRCRESRDRDAQRCL